MFSRKVIGNYIMLAWLYLYKLISIGVLVSNIHYSSLFKGVVRPIEKYAYLLSCREAGMIIDTTLMSTSKATARSQLA